MYVKQSRVGRIAGIIACGVALALPAAVQAQDEPAVITAPAGEDESVRLNTSKPGSARWDSLTRDPAFGYRNEVEYVKPEVKPEPPKTKPTTNWLADVIGAIFEFFASGVGKVLLWCLLIGIIGYVIFRVVAGDGSGLLTRRRRVGNEADAGDLEDEDLYGANWQRLMDDALQRGDARAAIRCSYMLLLQKLEETGRIRFRQDKTNAAYARELYDTPYRDAFRQLSRQYEYAWYGRFVPDAQGLGEHLNLFRSTIESLNR